MNAGYVLLIVFLIAVTTIVSFMTPHDRRIVVAAVADAIDAMVDEIGYQAKRLKAWWAERQAKKDAQKSYGGS